MAKSALPMTWIDYSHKPILCNCVLYNNHQRCSRDGAGPRLLYTCRTQVPTRPSDGTVTRQGLVCLRRFPAIAARVGEGPFTHPFRPPYPRMAAAARSNSQCNFPVRYRKSCTNGRRLTRPFAQLRGHRAKQGLAPMNEQVIEAVAASNSLRAAPFDNTKRRLAGRERHVVGHYRLGEALEG